MPASLQLHSVAVQTGAAQGETWDMTARKSLNKQMPNETLVSGLDWNSSQQRHNVGTLSCRGLAWRLHYIASMEQVTNYGWANDKWRNSFLKLIQHRVSESVQRNTDSKLYFAFQFSDVLVLSNIQSWKQINASQPTSRPRFVNKLNFCWLDWSPN